MSSRNNTKVNSSGIGILGVIQIVFIILKLTHLINWSWTVVLIPLWIQLGFIALIIAIVLGVYILYK